ncbi:hypothetical protein Tco_0872722 [Tanacetum coccineum]
MASMNTRLNIEKLDGNIVQKHGGSKQVPGVEIGVHGVHDEKRVWFEVELQGAQGDRDAEVFQVSNDDTAVAQRRLEDEQPEEKTNTDCLVKEQEKEYQTGWKEQEWVKAQNGLVNGETNVTLLAKVVLYRNMGLNESGEYKKKLTSFQCRCVSCSVTVVRNAVTTAMAITWSLHQLEARIATGLGKRRFPSKVPAQVECAGRIVLTNSDTKEKLLDIVVTLVNRLWV